MTASWIIGVILAVATGMVGALGKVLMRVSHLRVEASNNKGVELSAREKCKNNLILAFAFLCVIVLNPVLNLWAYTFASASMLAPFGGLPVAWNALLAPILVNEELIQNDYLGSFFIMVGTSLIAVGADHTDVSYTYDDLASLYLSYSFFIFLVGLGSLFAVLVAMYCKGGTWRSFAIGAGAGTVGGCQFLVKSISEIIANDLDSFTRSAGPYFILIGVLVVAGGGISILNWGLKTYEAVFLVPLYQSFMCLTGAMSGLAYFNEAANMAMWQFGMYFAGLCLILLGVLTIFKAGQTKRTRAEADKILGLYTNLDFDMDDDLEGAELDTLDDMDMASL